MVEEMAGRWPDDALQRMQVIVHRLTPDDEVRAYLVNKAKHVTHREARYNLDTWKDEMVQSGKHLDMVDSFEYSLCAVCLVRCGQVLTQASFEMTGVDIIFSCG